MGEKQEGKPVFSKARAELGIHAACDAFDKLDLTLMERCWAIHCMESAAQATLRDKFAELARIWGADEPSQVGLVQGEEDQVRAEGDGEG